MATKFPKHRTKEVVIAQWVSGLIPDPMGDDTVETVTRAMLAGLFYTAARLVETWDINPVQFQAVEKITLAVQTAAWNKQFVLRLSTTEPAE